MSDTVVAVSVDALRPKPKSKSKKHSKSKDSKDSREGSSVDLASKNKKRKRSKDSKKSLSSSQKPSPFGTDTSYPSNSSSKNNSKSNSKNNSSTNLSALTSKQKKRLKKKEKRLANKEFKKKSRGLSSKSASEEVISANHDVDDDEDPIPEPMIDFDDDNRDMILVSDDEDEEEDNESGNEDESTNNKESGNSLVNNDDFIQFDFSDDDDDDENDDEDGSDCDGDRNDDDDTAYVPSIRSREESDNSSDYAEPSLASGGKRKAKDSQGPPKKKHEYSFEFPWMNSGQDYSSYKEISDWLTKEIKDFVAYLSPSEAEIRARNEVVQRMQSLVSAMWPDATVNVFGSYATDMYLPGSDIDMVITSPSGRLVSKTFLYQLSSKLRSTPGFAEKVTTIGKARVPIIKFVDRQSKIHIDISFERRNGLTAVEHIRKWAEEFPCLRHLVMPIKQFLAFRKLNDVSVGGIGGYSIICTVVSFLAMHPRVSSGMIDPMKNLGPLLIEYFELYGKKFNFDRVALRMDPSGGRSGNGGSLGGIGYVSKSSIPELCNSGPRPVPHALVIEDPDDPNNNLGRSTYNILKIRAALAGAYEFIIAKCYELSKAPKSKRRNQSIIGSILKMRGPERDFLDQRDSVENIAWTNQNEGEEDDDDEEEEDEQGDSDEDDNNGSMDSYDYKLNQAAQDRSVLFETGGSSSDDGDSNSDNDDYDPAQLNVSRSLNLQQQNQKRQGQDQGQGLKPKKPSQSPPPPPPPSFNIPKGPRSTKFSVNKTKPTLETLFNTSSQDSDDDDNSDNGHANKRQKKDDEKVIVIDSDEESKGSGKDSSNNKPIVIDSDEDDENYEPSFASTTGLTTTRNKTQDDISKSEEIELRKQAARKKRFDHWK